MSDLKKWDMRFLELAQLVSTWSKDPGTQVGSVITDRNNRVVSLGYNGFPRMIKDDERLQDRDKKYSMTLHAEENAILFARRDLESCTIYVYPFPSCSSCASKIIQTGINRIVSLNNFPERWKENFENSIQMFTEAGVDVNLYHESELK